MDDARAEPPGFFAGMTYPLRGARFVFRTHPVLMRYWLVPIVVTVAAFAGLVSVLVQYHTEIVASVWQPTQSPGVLGWLTRTLHSMLDWLLAIVIFALGGFAILLGSSVLAAPFNEALSGAVERIQGSLPSNTGSVASTLADILRSVGMELGKLLVLGAIMLPLLILNVVLPPVGGPLLVIVGPLISVTYVAIDYTDWPAARRGVDLRGRLLLLRHHPRPLLGFGIAAWALLFVPGLNLLLMPAAVAGGTLLYLDLEVWVRGEASVDAPVGPTFPS